MRGRLLPRLFVFSLLAALAVVAGCRKAAHPAAKLVLAASPTPYSGLVYIALEKGYFSDCGVDPTLQEHPSGLAASKALVQGEADMACVSDFAFIQPAAQDPSLRIVASIASANTHEVVARRDKGVNAPRDLRGRKIGYSANTTGEFYLSIFLLMNGLREGEVRLVDIPAERLVDALASGEVDAISSWETVVLAARQRLGDALLGWPSQGGQDFFWTLASREDFLRREPRAIEGVLRALIKAEEFARENGDEARALISRHWSGAPDDALWKRVRLSTSLNQALVISLEGAAGWRAEHRAAQGKAMPNAIDFISFDSLARVAPDRVTAFR